MRNPDLTDHEPFISSRAVGYRFGPHLGDTVPVLINYCTSASENDEELREYSLQVFYLLIRVFFPFVNIMYWLLCFNAL